MLGIDRSHAAGGKCDADFGAVQIREQGIPRGQNKDKSEWNGNRRRRICGDGRAVLGGIGKTDHAGGGRRGESRRENAARRRVQAADFPVRFSGDGRRRLEAAEKGEGSDGARDYHGSDERPRC